MKTKNNFEPFSVGSVFNPKKVKGDCLPIYESVTIKYPSRLNAMCLDPEKITSNNNLCYTPGEIIFKVNIFKSVTVKILKQNKICISEDSKKKPLIKHSALLMKKALRYKGGFDISIKDDLWEVEHAGLGSSSGVIASVACAINELFGRPLSSEDLLAYLAQNHGEEIKGNNRQISPVQCIGGSAAGGLYNGGMIVIAGQSTVISQMDIGDEYSAVIGIPRDFKPLDSQILLNLEIESFPKFLRCGKEYSKLIAYRVIHELLPAMKKNNLGPIGDLIFDYRFKMGSIDNCSYCYKNMNIISKKISFLKTDGVAEVLSLSSVGPGFFAITKRPKDCVKTFEENNLKTYVTKIYNNSYEVLNKIKI